MDLAAAANLTASRFSLNWTRLFPDSDGARNEAGFAFYHRLIDVCFSRGLDPWICLYRWDYSQAPQERGGWAARDALGRPR